VPKDYATRVCKEFCLLGESYFIIQLSGANDLFLCLSCTGSRGVSIIFSSGDAGVGDGDSDPATQQCFSNDGKNKTIFLPQFPASCPLCVMSITVSPHINSQRSCCLGSVTTVGGTQGIPETAASFSGGGFSNYVSSNPLSLVLCNNCIDTEKQVCPTGLAECDCPEIPRWPSQRPIPRAFQPVRVLSFPFIQSFSPTWFSTCPCPCPSHSAGRVCSSIPLSLYQPLTFIGYPLPFSQAYPDVSAQSRRFLIYFQGLAGLISGTSAAAPTFAGIVSLLNDANIAAGKPPLGFLNPMLYSIGAGGLNDITQGNAPGCGTPGFSVRGLSLLFYGGLTY
jgi:hypothetical protein